LQIFEPFDILESIFNYDSVIETLNVCFGAPTATPPKRQVYSRYLVHYRFTSPNELPNARCATVT